MIQYAFLFPHHVLRAALAAAMSWWSIQGIAWNGAKAVYYASITRQADEWMGKP